MRQDPLVITGLENSELMDGFALGITLLMVLTARVAVVLTRACEEALESPELALSIADDLAAWPALVAVEVTRVVAGLVAPRMEGRGGGSAGVVAPRMEWRGGGSAGVVSP